MREIIIHNQSYFQISHDLLIFNSRGLLNSDFKETKRQLRRVIRWLDQAITRAHIISTGSNKIKQIELSFDAGGHYYTGFRFNRHAKNLELDKIIIGIIDFTVLKKSDLI